MVLKRDMSLLRMKANVKECLQGKDKPFYAMQEYRRHGVCAHIVLELLTH